MKRVVLILLILTIPALAIAQNPSRHELNRSLNHITQLVDQGKALMGTDVGQFRTFDDYMAHSRATKKNYRKQKTTLPKIFLTLIIALFRIYSLLRPMRAIYPSYHSRWNARTIRRCCGTLTKM